MSTLTIELSDEQRERLEEIARREGKSVSQVVQDVLAPRLAASSPEPPHRVFHLFNSGEGDGTSIADIPEEEYLKGFGEQ